MLRQLELLLKQYFSQISQSDICSTADIYSVSSEKPGKEKAVYLTHGNHHIAKKRRFILVHHKLLHKKYHLYISCQISSTLWCSVLWLKKKKKKVLSLKSLQSHYSYLLTVFHCKLHHLILWVSARTQAIHIQFVTLTFIVSFICSFMDVASKVRCISIIFKTMFLCDSALAETITIPNMGISSI